MARRLTPLAFVLGAVAGSAIGVGTALLAFPTGRRLFAERPARLYVERPSGPWGEPPRPPPARTTDAPEPRSPSAADDPNRRRWTKPPPDLSSFPSVTVRVVHARERASVDAVVYALPAGAAGADDEADVARAYTDASGVCDLHVVAPGTYDVGAIDGFRRVLARDVSIPSEEMLVLRFEATDDVAVVADPALASRLSASTDAVRVLFARTDRPQKWARYPGREEQRRVAAWLSGTRDRHVLALPRARWRVTDAEGRFPVAVRPAEFGAASSVAVSPTGAELAATVRFVPTSARPDRGARFLLRLRAGDEDLRLEPQEVAAGRPLSVLRTRASWPVRAESGVLEWSGEGVRTGSVPFSADRAGRASVDVPVELDPDRAAPASLERRLRVVAEGGVPPADTRVVPLDPSRRRSATFRWDPDRGEGVARVAECERMVAVGGGEWVSDVVRFADVADGDTLRLRRGGFLVLSPDRVLPPGVTVHVRHAEAAPLPTSTHLFGWDDAERREVVPGTVLGPFVPGPVRLRVRSCGVDLGEVVATVRAGEHVPVVIPTSPRKR
jgi:hypothetical protein